MPRFEFAEDATRSRQLGRRRFVVGAGMVGASLLAGAEFAAPGARALATAGSPLRAAGAQLFGDSDASASLLGELLALVPEEAVPSPSTWVDFFLPAVTLDALWPRMELELAFAPNPHSLAFNTMPDADQLREVLAATPMAVEGFLRAGDVMLIRGAFDREPVHAAWTALGYAPGNDPDIFAFVPADPERASDELSELHDRLQLPGNYGMWAYLCLLEDDTVVAVDDPALIDAMRSVTDDPAAVAAVRPLAGADTAALSMGRIRFGDQLPTRSRRPARAGERSERIDQRNDEVLAEVAAELGPMPALSSLLAGSTPGAPWVDDMAGPSSPVAAYVALIEPTEPADAGAVVEIVKRRFETTFSVRHEAPHTELLSLDVAEVDEANGVARFEFSQVGSRRFDLEYFLWYEDAPFLYADPG